MKKLKNIAEVEAALNELQTVEAEIEEKTADANKDIAKLRSTVTPLISEKEELAKRLRSQIEAWAEDNREDEELFPKGRKTLELRGGTISFRENPYKIELLEGWEDEEVLDELGEADASIKKAGIKKGKPTINKTALKNLYTEGKIDDEALAELGLKASKEEETASVTTKTLEAYEA